MKFFKFSPKTKMQFLILGILALWGAYNIILVNDGSVDNSEHLIKSKIKNSNKILLLSHRHNIGYGAAIKTGIEYSKNLASYVVFADSDLTNPIDDIKKISIFRFQDM